MNDRLARILLLLCREMGVDSFIFFCFFSFFHLLLPATLFNSFSLPLSLTLESRVSYPGGRGRSTKYAIRECIVATLLWRHRKTRVWIHGYTKIAKYPRRKLASSRHISVYITRRNCLLWPPPSLPFLHILSLKHFKEYQNMYTHSKGKRDAFL